MNDLRFAFRQLLKNPGFTVVAVLTLAIGIGASSTVFSLVQGVLLTPPPYSQPDRMVLITPTRVDGQRYTRGWPAAQWQEWQTESKSFEAIAGYGWTFNFLVLPDGSESIEGMAVTREYFKVAGLQPVLGRGIVDSDLSSEQQTTIILGHDLWQRRFRGDPGVIGQAVQISRYSQPLTVVGVMPPNVRFLPSPNVTSEPNYNVDAKVDYWLPQRPNPSRLKRPDWNIVGRLRPGVTVAEAETEIAAMAARQARNERDFEGIAPRLHPLEAHMNREGRRLLMPVAAAVALVFLIACGNAAGLLLARGLQRQHEYAVRSALGARPLQLCRPVLLESLLLALLGGLAGTGLAAGCVEMLKVIAAAAIPRLDAVRLGWPVMGFCLSAASVAGLFAGLLPAWRSMGLDPANVLKAGSRTASVGRVERRLLSGVAAVQIALTLALLVGAGLLIQTAHSLARVRPGYDTQNILTMSVTAVGTNWLDFHTRAIENVAALPGVKAVAFGWGVPLTGNKWYNTFEIDGEAAADEKDRLQLPTRSATPDYFAVLGLRLVEGRVFRPGDNDKAPRVVIINQAAANRYFPDRNPIGRKLRFPGNRTNLLEIIGILADTRTDGLTDAAEPELYFSFWQAGAFSKHLVVRTHADPRPLAAVVQRELRAIDPTVSVENVKTLEQIRADSVASRTFAMNVLVGFALVACLLATVSIYGVLSLTVGARQTEIAIRMAVGAQREDVLRLILGDGLRLAAVGVGLGLLIAIALGAGLRTYLFGVAPTDALTLIAMVIVLLALTLIVCWIPARRAARVEPLAALRNE
jgi:putative ABC transport system permease protein